MNILLTGGTGFIGSYVLEILKKNNNSKILVLSRSKNKKTINDNVIWHSCDLSESNSYKNIVHEFAPNILIHLSWEGIPDFSYKMCLKNLNSSIELINIVASSSSIKKILVTGSCFEYNKFQGECNETHNCVSKDYFTWSKNAVLDYLKLKCTENNISYSWSRLFYVYGPGQREKSLIPVLINFINQNQVPELRTPKNSNDFVYVEDVAKCIVEMSLNFTSSGIYNIGSGQSTPILDITKIAENIINNDNKLTKKLFKNSIKSLKTVDFWANLDKTKKDFKWLPETSLHTGISKLINHNL
tara:strand:+ start:4534 stop:5433 length:900 start_codon:yes stop_codon:yes gene_type:complete